MNVRNFLYWLQGYFEISEKPKLGKSQLVIIKQHLDLVAKNDEKLSSEASKFLGDLYSAVDFWLKHMPSGKYLAYGQIKKLDEELKKQFLHAANDENPFLDGYEPLGDIYNNQRLC